MKSHVTFPRVNHGSGAARSKCEGYQCEGYKCEGYRFYRWVSGGLALSLLLGVALPVYALPRWSAELRLDPVQRRLEGPVRLYLPPTSAGQAQTVVYFPAQLARGKKTDELTTRWTYPHGYQPASLQLEALEGRPAPTCSAQPHSGQPHSGQPHSGQPHSGQPHSGQPHSAQPSSPEGLLQSCRWPTPREPSAPSWEAQLRLELPERLGPFGYVGEQLTLAGGWLPLLLPLGSEQLPPSQPPEPVEVELRLSLPSALSAWLEGQPLMPCPTSEAAGQSAELPGAESTSYIQLCGRTTARFPVLQVMPPRPALQVLSLSPHVKLIEPRLRLGERVRLEKLVASLETFWRAQGLGDVPPTVLSRAPLRRSLTLPGEGVLLLSDRAMRTAPGIRHFQTLAVAQALLEHWLRRQLEAASSPLPTDRQTDLPTDRQTDLPTDRPTDRQTDLPVEGQGSYSPALEQGGLQPWELAPVAALLADTLLSAYRETLPGGRWKARALLAPLRIFPPVDGLLNAPKFPFSQEIYEWPYRWDALQESPAALLNPGQGGEAVRHQLELEVGEAAVRRVLQALLLAPSPERSASAIVGMRRLDPLSLLAQQENIDRRVLEARLRSLQQPPPQVDFRVVSVRSTRVPGGHQTELSLETRGTVPEPVPQVPIQLEAGRERPVLRWTAQAQERLVVQTEQPVRRVTLDPHEQLLETNAAGTRLRDNNVWPPPARLLFQAVLTSVELERLRPTGSALVLLTRPNQRDWLLSGEAYSSQQVLLGGTVGGFRFLGPYRDAQWRSHRLGVQLNLARRQGLSWLGESSEAYLNTTGLRLSYRYDDRLLLQDSGRGAAAYVGLEAGQAQTLSETGPYGLVSLQGVKPVGLSRAGVSTAPLLVLRAQLELGLGLPTGAGGPGEGLFVLGGPSLVRGLENGARYGNLRWVSSAELRTPVAQELDLNLLLARLRRIQLVPFVDAGAIGYEGADLLSPALGVGLGWRLYLDMLGLYEGLAGVDFAWEPAALGTGVAGAAWPQVLLRFAQPF